MRKYAWLFAFVAPTLLAQTADLEIISFHVDQTALITGQRFTVSMRWRNNGPEGVGNVVAELGNGSGAFVLTGAGTSNWPCEPALAAASFTCRGVMPPGGEAEMVVTMRAAAKPQGGTTMVLAGSVSAPNVTDDPSNNSHVVELPLTVAASTSALSVSPSQQEHHVSGGGRVTIPVNVTNSGPDAAENVVVSLAFAPGLHIPVSGSGSGWSCRNATHAPWLLLCNQPALASGTSAPITVEATAPAAEGSYFFTARASAEHSFDPNVENDWGSAVVHVGEAQNWERILVPLLPAIVPGANGALWKSQTTMLVASDTPVEIHPVLCDYVVLHCAGEPFWPLRRPFDAGEAGLLGYAAARGGQFYYVRPGDAAKVWLNSRVWDTARETQTAGSEIPIVRERDLVAGTNSIVGIPLAPHDRYMLRVYDFDAHDGGRVVIRIYAGDETTPRAEVIRTLSVAADLRTTTARLPIFPGYLEVDPLTLASVGDAGTMRIDIAPADENLRLWSFVSVTNNETHHVTTFSVH